MEKWLKTGEFARFVRYTDEGVLLRCEDGTIQWECFDDIDGWPVWREVFGSLFFVPDAMVNYRPSGDFG